MENTDKTFEMSEKIGKYLKDNVSGLPILKECCLLNGWDYDELLELSAEDSTLARVVKTLETQYEVNLVKGGVLGNFNKPMVQMLLERETKQKAEKSMFSKLEILDRILQEDRQAAFSTNDTDEFVRFVQGNMHNGDDYEEQ